MYSIRRPRRLCSGDLTKTGLASQGTKNGGCFVFRKTEYNLSNMSPDIASTLDAEPKPMSEIARLTGVFFEPGKTFADIAQRPRWFVPLLIGVLFSIGYLYAFSSHIGWEPYLRRTFDNNARIQQMPQEQRDQIFNTQLKYVGTISMVSVVVAAPLLVLLWAGIATGIIKGLLGVPLRFKQAFAALCYAGLARILYAALSTV